MVSALAFLIGAILAVALIRLARKIPPARERRIYAVGLVVAAIVYVVLGVAGRATTRWLAWESIGVFIYGTAALVGLRGWPALLALGWAAHVAWDVLLHVNGAGAEYTPHWYPWLCVSFDLVMAVAVLISIRRENSQRPH